MTSPGGVEVARVSVRAVADASKLPAELKAQLERIESRLRVELPASLGRSNVVADARRLAALAEASAKVQLATLLDTTAVTAQLSAVQRQVDARPVEVDLDVPAREQAEVVRKVDSTRRLLERNPIRIPLEVDTSSLAAVSRQIASLGGTLAGAGVGAVAGQALAGGLVAIAGALAQTAGAMALIPAAGVAGVAVVGTLKLGLLGLEDALTADTPKKYAEALEKLSPQARNLVVALRDLAPAFDRVRESVQDRLLDRLSNDAQALAEVYLPLAKRGLGEIAGELNTGIRQLAGFGREAATIRVFRDALGDSARATSLLSEAMRPAARGLRSLVDVGTEFLPGLAAKVAVLAEKWSAMVQRSADDGRLQEWISQALANIGDLLGIVGNVGKAFSAVFRAGQSAGAGLLDTVRDITKEIADSANSARGQQTLGTFLASARQMALALLPLLGSVVQLVGGQLAPLLARVGATVIPALVKAVDSIGVALGKAGPGIETFAAGAASLVSSLAEGGAIAAVGELAGALGGALGDALAKIGPKLAELVSAVAGELSGALPDVVSGIADVAVSLGDLLIAGSPLIGFLGRLVSEVGLPVLQRVAQNLTPIIRDLTKWLTEGDLAAKLPEIADGMVQFVDELAPLVSELLDTGKELVDTLVPHMDDIIGSMKDLAQAALPVAKTLTAVAAAVAFVSKNIDDLVETVPGLKAALGEKGLFGTLMSFSTPLGPLKGIYDSVAGLTKIMTGEYPDAVRTFNDYTLKLGEGSRLTYDDIKRAGEDTLTGLFGLFQEHAPKLTDIFLGELFTMQDGQRSIFGQMLADLTDHWGRMDAEIAERTFGISDKVDSAWKRVAESTRREWEETERRVAEGITDVAFETSKLPGAVRDSLGNIAGVLYPSGSSLIAGFIQGMKAQEFAARRVAAAIMESVAGAFPSSPAKYGPFSGQGWTPYRGAALVEGFAEGMTKSIGSAVKAAEQVANSVADQLPTGSQFPGLVGGSAPSVYAPIDARGTDPEKVAAIVPHRLMSALNTT